MKTFSIVSTRASTASNDQIAQDFMDLSFNLENGEKVRRFSRFEGPITVRVIGDSGPSLDSDLDQLLTRLRREARIPIRRVAAEQDASITVQSVSAEKIDRAVPSAACFVRPNVSDWNEYRARRNDPATRWPQLERRTRMAVFLPSDSSPQGIRDCLHEEIGQALGPVNDLFRLTQSVFNDDNFHGVLTSFDMLILRTYYDSKLQAGMREPEVAFRLSEILDRINPQGRGGGFLPSSQPQKAWHQEIAKAHSKKISMGVRRSSANQAVRLARRFGPTDPRLAYSYYLLGRFSTETQPDTALKAYLNAIAIYRARDDTKLQAARVGLRLAAFQLEAGNARDAIALANQSLDDLQRAQDAARLSLLLLIKAEALDLLAKPSEAQRVRNEALAWGQYGFKNRAEVLERADEIQAISPRARQGGSL